MQVIMQRQARANRAGEASDDLLDQSGTLKSDVHPLGQIAGETGSILLFGVE